MKIPCTLPRCFKHSTWSIQKYTRSLAVWSNIALHAVSPPTRRNKFISLLKILRSRRIRQRVKPFTPCFHRLKETGAHRFLKIHRSRQLYQYVKFAQICRMPIRRRSDCCVAPHIIGSRVSIIGSVYSAFFCILFKVAYAFFLACFCFHWFFNSSLSNSSLRCFFLVILSCLIFCFLSLSRVCRTRISSANCGTTKV